MSNMINKILFLYYSIMNSCRKMIDGKITHKKYRIRHFLSVVFFVFLFFSYTFAGCSAWTGNYNTWDTYTWYDSEYSTNCSAEEVVSVCDWSQRIPAIKYETCTPVCLDPNNYTWNIYLSWSVIARYITWLSTDCNADDNVLHYTCSAWYTWYQRIWNSNLNIDILDTNYKCIPQCIDPTNWVVYNLWDVVNKYLDSQSFDCDSVEESFICTESPSVSWDWYRYNVSWEDINAYQYYKCDYLCEDPDNPGDINYAYQVWTQLTRYLKHFAYNCNDEQVSYTCKIWWWTWDSSVDISDTYSDCKNTCVDDDWNSYYSWYKWYFYTWKVYTDCNLIKTWEFECILSWWEFQRDPMPQWYLFSSCDEVCFDDRIGWSSNVYYNIWDILTWYKQSQSLACEESWNLVWFECAHLTYWIWWKPIGNQYYNIDETYANCNPIIAQCWINNWNYSYLDYEWRYDWSTWFCKLWNIVWSIPVFPKPIDRSGGIQINWTCDNQWATVNCTAQIDEFKPCGPNASEYSSFEQNWKVWDIFPEPFTWFCAVGVPWWDEDVDFPNILERKNGDVYRSRYCEINWDRSSICTAKIDAVHDWKCGINATTYDFDKTQWIQNDSTWFCAVGTPFFTTNSEFDRLRDHDILKSWICKSPDLWEDVSCQAVLKKNIPECSDLVNQSILNIDIYWSSQLCSLWVANNISDNKLQEPFTWYCQTYSSDDKWLIWEVKCSAHKSCTWNWYEYSHNQETIPVPIDWECWSANWHNFSIADNRYWLYQQCSQWYPDSLIFPAINSIVSWKCLWLNWWKDSDYCYAMRFEPVPGKCWLANGHTFAPEDTSYTSLYRQCEEGIPTNTKFPDIWSSVSWKCEWKYWWISETCRAVRADTGEVITWECWWADGHKFLLSDLRYTTEYNQCNKWIPSIVEFPEPWQTITWICRWLNGWADSKICSTSREDNSILTWVCGSIATETTSTGVSDIEDLCSVWQPTISVNDFIFDTWDHFDSITWSCLWQNWWASSFCQAWQDNSQVYSLWECWWAGWYIFDFEQGWYYSWREQCKYWTSDNVEFPEPWQTVTWTCYWSSWADYSQTCYASRALNWICWDANLKVYTWMSVVDTWDYCLRWSATNLRIPETGNSVSWICTWLLWWVNSQVCTTRVQAGDDPEDWECWTANWHIFSLNDLRYTTNYYQCEKWIPTKVEFPEPWQTVTWQCIWPNWWNNSPTCSASRASVVTLPWKCWPINNYTYLTGINWWTWLDENGEPIFSWVDDLCEIGTPTFVQFPQPWQTVTWICIWSWGVASDTCKASLDPWTKTYIFKPGWIYSWYLSTQPPIWKSCEDIKVYWHLTCDDWVWMSGDQILQNYAESCNDLNNQTCLFNWRILQNWEKITAFRNSIVPYGQSCSDYPNEEVFECVWWVLSWINFGGYYWDYKYSSCEEEQAKDCQVWTNFWNTQTISNWKSFYWYKQWELEWDQNCNSTWTNWNMALLECRDWKIFYKGTNIETNDYQYLSCTNREPKDCIFNWQVIKHWDSVTWRNVQQAWVNQECLSESRTCIDWVLSGSYQYDHCWTVDWECWEASWQNFSEFPKYNLCSQWKLYIPDTWSVADDKRTWMCLGYWGKNATCFANKISDLALFSWKCVDYDSPVFYLSKEMTDKLCESGIVLDFKKYDTWWSWSCSWTLNVVSCQAINDILPKANVIYSTTWDTDWAVIARLTWFNLPWIQILNNDWKLEHLFTGNWEFTFELEVDWKQNNIVASVSWINERQNIWQKLLWDYEKNLCPLYQNIKFQDLHTAPYTVAIQTMINNCIMHWYKFTNRNLFLPNNRLTRLEALTVLSRLWSAITHYYWDRIDDPWYWNYKNVFIRDELAAHIVWANKIWMLQYLKQISLTWKVWPKNKKLNYDMILVSKTNISSGSFLVSWSVLSKWTKFIKWVDILDKDPEIISWLQLSWLVLDERNSSLLEDYEYHTWWVLDKNIVAWPWSFFKKWSWFTNDVVLQKSWILIDRNKPITRQEFEQMLSHFLRIHWLDYHLKDRLFNEIKFRYKNYITRWETAYIITRLLEPYEWIPIGNDYLFLNALYEKIKNFDVNDMKLFLYKLQIVLSRMSKDTLNNYWLTKWRLLSDIDAIRKNKMPDRKPKLDIDIEKLWRKWQDRYDVENVLGTWKMDFYLKDRYDDIDF